MLGWGELSKYVVESTACMERADGRSGRGATRPVLRVGYSRGSPALTDRAKSRPVAPAWSLRPRGFELAGACLALCGGGHVEKNGMSIHSGHLASIMAIAKTSACAQ